MANFFSGNFFRRVFRFIALLVALVAGILFANAITIFQEPENRLRNGDTAPSVEPDAFPLVIVSLQLNQHTGPSLAPFLTMSTTGWNLHFLERPSFSCRHRQKEANSSQNITISRCRIMDVSYSFRVNYDILIRALRGL